VISTRCASQPPRSLRKPLRGFTLVEIMIVVAIVALLAAIAIPNIIRAQKRSKAAACISNMRVVDTAIQELKIERPGTALTEDNIRVFIGRGNGGAMPKCPSGGTYENFDTIVTCTIQEVGFEHTLPQ
jgi:prepilin-type N-terminal cleavage/methylation domain-containing protein